MRKGYHTIAARPLVNAARLIDERELARVPGVHVDDIELYTEDIGRMLIALKGEFKGNYRKAYALAHHQVSREHARFFVVADEWAERMFGQQVIINPRIEAFHGEPTINREGCMSHPYRPERKVTRREGIRASWDTPDGKRVESELEGMAALVFQHEIDHCDGKTVWLDKVPRA